MDKATIIILVVGIAVIAFLLSKKKSAHKTTPPKTTTGWYFGPIIGGKNYSAGMPASPTMQGSGWFFDFKPGVEVDAVVNGKPPYLVGAKSLTMRYAVEGSGFQAAGENNVSGRVGLMLQRKGDDWSGKGKYQQYRLYGQSRPLLAAGEGQVTATTFTDVQGQVVSQAVVDAVLADLDCYAVVFGGSFASHGVLASPPARFTFRGLDIS